MKASLAPRPEGERLTDGEDFARVFSHLDSKPRALTYVNLPKVRALVQSSQLIQTLLAANPEAKDLVGFFLSAEFTAMGLGNTSVGVDGGVRTTTFGPPGLSGGSLSAGMVAAVALPNFWNAVDRGKQKRTMADIRTIAIACEAFAVDHDRYPGPTDGWVHLDAIAGDLEPQYVRSLPRADGWGHAIEFWSDGESYLIVSPGKDGAFQRDWRGDIETGPTGSFAEDIVFGDGEFLAWPEGEQQDTPAPELEAPEDDYDEFEDEELDRSPEPVRAS